MLNLNKINIVNLIAMMLIVTACVDSQHFQSESKPMAFYVQSGASHDGDGKTYDNPFSSLQQVERTSGPGDFIYVIKNGIEILDGGIVLKPGQKLIGMASKGEKSVVNSAVRISNSTFENDGVVIKLSHNNEISGIEITSRHGNGIAGIDFSGANIHDNVFTRLPTNETDQDDPVWSIFLDLKFGITSDVLVSGNLFKNSNRLGGVMVAQSGDSNGNYRFESNTYVDIGHGMHFNVSDTSNISVRVLKMTAENISTDGKRCNLFDESCRQIGAGITVRHSKNSIGSYGFSENKFNRLEGNAMIVWSRDSSYVETNISNCYANNIGVGNNNSDSIGPGLSGDSEQIWTVQNYHYKNTDQVGLTASNTALEAILYPKDSFFPLPCDGCKLTLKIVDSLFEDLNAMAGIQFVNWGTNGTMDVEVKDTKLVFRSAIFDHPKLSSSNLIPGRYTSGIQFIPAFEQGIDNRSSLKVENTEVDSAGFGLTIIDIGLSHSVVDFGGGDLGSAGGNRITNSKRAEVLVVNANPADKNSWIGKKVFWGGNEPRIEYRYTEISKTTDVEDKLPEDSALTHQTASKFDYSPALR
ncbi:hypothetical protein N2488_02825 [SAR92 clade bacterium H231]|nr:hypothetical protein [SAR92 clade bacterium H231]